VKNSEETILEIAPNEIFKKVTVAGIKVQIKSLKQRERSMLCNYA